LAPRRLWLRENVELSSSIMRLRLLASALATLLAQVPCLLSADGRPLTVSPKLVSPSGTNAIHVAPRLTLVGSSSTEELRSAAIAGDANARFELGVRYYLGSNVPPSTAEAVKWWRTAAEDKHPGAAFNLGAVSLQDPGSPTNRIEAFEWFCLAAVWGDSDAVQVLRGLAGALKPDELIAGIGRAYGRYGKDIDLAGTLPSTRDPAVQTLLGEAYAQGAGVPQDYHRARAWFERAAAQGNRLAQSALGTIFLRGSGVPKDLREAANWYRKAAETGDPDSAWYLSQMYEKGQGVEPDKAQSLKWLQRAADAGQRDAQNQLAFAYFNGVGMEKDRAKGVAYLERSAVAGNTLAQATLGALYSSGEGVPKDDSKALEWLTKSALAGNSSGQFNLGLLYSEGQGVNRDRVEAYKWLWLAEQQGHHTAAEARQDLAREMSPAEIAEALERAHRVASTNRGGVAPNPQGGASGRQPSGSEINRRSAPAASRGSP
jgi:TPR repeat protein